MITLLIVLQLFSCPGRAQSDKDKDFEDALADPIAAFHMSRAPADPEQSVAQEVLDKAFTPEELRRLEFAATILSEDYVDSVDKKKLMYGALKGMAASLDPYSRFYTPEEYKEFKDLTTGKYAGVGMRLPERPAGQPQSISIVYPGSPAEKAGVRSGDQLVEVDGVPVRPLDNERIVLKIKGPKGVPVRLKIAREDPATGRLTVFEAVAVRDDIETNNVLVDMPKRGVGYIYLDSFRRDPERGVDSYVQVLSGLEQLRRAGAKSLILDLRGNGGGNVAVCLDILGLFFPYATPVYVEKERLGPPHTHLTDGKGEFADLPLIVLIDGGTASAAEILAGAVQDRKRGRLVGTRSYGKGLVQTRFEFKDGSALIYTALRWYTPFMRSIQRDDSGNGGMAPDALVDVSEGQEYSVVDQIVRRLNGAPAPKAPVSDPILAAALDPR